MKRKRNTKVSRSNQKNGQKKVRSFNGIRAIEIYMEDVKVCAVCNV
jgi:hypothetical protein